MKKKAKNQKIWVVIPAYNEAKYIQTVLRKTKKFSRNIVVVDDGSKDETVKLAKKLTPYVLEHEINLGKGAALKTGIDFAFNILEAEAVVILDSDDQHDPSEIVLFEEALANKAQVVFGKRMMSSKMPFLRIFFNRLASYVVWFLFGEYIPDIPSGYKAFTKESYKIIRWESTGYEVETEIAARVAKYHIPYQVVTISTIYHDYVRGMTFLDVLTIINKIVSWRLWL